MSGKPTITLRDADRAFLRWVLIVAGAVLAICTVALMVSFFSQDTRTTHDVSIFWGGVLNTCAFAVLGSLFLMDVRSGRIRNRGMVITREKYPIGFWFAASLQVVGLLFLLLLAFLFFAALVP